MKQARIEYFKSPFTFQKGTEAPVTHWYWRLRARNGYIIADGAEGYSSRSNVRRAIKRFLMITGAEYIEVVEV